MGKAILAGVLRCRQLCVDTLGSLHRFTDHTITDPARLLAELDETAGRAAGRSTTTSVTRASAPWPCRSVATANHARAAVGVQGPADRIPDERLADIVDSLSTSAHRLSLHLQITF